MTQVNQNVQNEGQDNLSMTIDPNNENYSDDNRPKCND